MNRLIHCIWGKRSLQAIASASLPKQSVAYHIEGLTIISSALLTLIPFLFTTCKYLNPLRTSCCTTNLAFMRNWAPSLMVNGFFLRSSRAPGAVKSMVKSGRPSTSRAKDLMTQRRVSLGSTLMAGDEESPREAFQRLRDSSF